MKNSAIIETYLSNNNEKFSYQYTAIYCMYDTLISTFDNLSDIAPSITLIRTNK